MATNGRVVLVIVVIVVVPLLLGAGLLFLTFRSGFTNTIDAQFGDQHLKTSVALLELHRTRYGAYPESLADLKFIGDWDRIALSRVAYTPAPDHRSYYIEVTTGWVAKPTLSLPEEFWRGTGYRPILKPQG